MSKIIGIDGNEANVIHRVGSGQYGFELLCALAKIKTDHKFEIFLKNQPHEDLPKESSNWVYRVFGPKKLWTQIALPMNLYLGSPKIDVFFSPSHYAPRFSNVKQVITIFDLSYIHFPQSFAKKDLYQLRNWSAYSVGKADKIITISQSSKKDIIEIYKIKPEKITVTYPGVGEQFSPRSGGEVKSVMNKYGINSDYIIYVGTLQPRKNLVRLLEAVEKVIRQLGLEALRGEQPKSLTTQEPNNLVLVIVGKKGWLYDEIFSAVKELNLEGKVIFTDFVPDDDLPALFSGAKAYVNVSLWEGFGIPVAEAQACGTPVVVSNTSSLPEVVGDSGVQVDPEDADSIARGILKIVTDEKFAQSLVKNGFENIKRFSWENCAKQTLEVLSSV
ncbi:MAG TPA: glycosyltransferase family 1 protein [Patescibacteria group bacterium]